MDILKRLFGGSKDEKTSSPGLTSPSTLAKEDKPSMSPIAPPLNNGINKHEKEVAAKRGKSVFSGTPHPKILKQWHSNGMVATAVAISPDGMHVAQSGDSTVIEVRALPSAELVQTLQGHQNNVCCIRYSPDGSRLMSGSEDGDIRYWDLKDGRCLFVLKGHHGIISSLAFARDGSTAASASWDKSVRIWNLSSGDCKSELSGHQDKVTAIALSPDGKYAISTAVDSMVLLWEFGAEKPPVKLPGHQGSVTCVAISANGGKVLTGATDGRMAMSDLPLTELRSLRPLSAGISNILGSQDGSMWLLGLQDGGVWLMNDKTGDITELFRAPSKWGDAPLATCISLSADYTRLLVSRTNTVGLFEFE
jgi:WD40 repeat protein